jgi:hypothetical protein
MAEEIQMQRARLWWLLACLCVGVAVLPGCTTADRPVEPLPTALDLPACCRNHVWFFLLGDFHPCHELEKLRSQLIDAGYIKVYCGQVYHLWHFAAELKKVHQDDPEARFVIIGQGIAASAARDLASRAVDAGAPIDLFVYLDDVSDPGPIAAPQVIAIHGPKDGNADVPKESEYVLADAGLKGVAGHSQTLTILLRYLEPVCACVPLVDHGPPCDLPPSPVSGIPDGWDFLRPDGNDIGAIGEPPLMMAPGVLPATMEKIP